MNLSWLKPTWGKLSITRRSTRVQSITGKESRPKQSIFLLKLNKRDCFGETRRNKGFYAIFPEIPELIRACRLLQLSSVHDFMDQNQPIPVETWTTAQGYGTRSYGPSHPIMAEVRPSGQFMQDV